MSDKRKRHRNGNKAHDGSNRRDEMKENVDESSEVVKMFRGFQTQLDNKHDKYERIVKLSRDITIESKRIIFTLHRVKDKMAGAETLEETEKRLLELENTKFLEVAKELVHTDPYQFLRAYTAGLQEYIEALTFHFFLKDNLLIPHQKIQDRLVFEHDKAKDGEETSVELEKDTIRVLVPPTEYVLGIADLTGEMMRRAINSVADGELDRPFEICLFLQSIESAYSALNNCNREVNRKLSVLRQSLRKVEAACYTLKVRGSEIPKHMLVDVISKNTTNAAQFLDDPLVIDEN